MKNNLVETWDTFTKSACWNIKLTDETKEKHKDRIFIIKKLLEFVEKYGIEKIKAVYYHPITNELRILKGLDSFLEKELK